MGTGETEQGTDYLQIELPQLTDHPATLLVVLTTAVTLLIRAAVPLIQVLGRSVEKDLADGEKLVSVLEARITELESHVLRLESRVEDLLGALVKERDRHDLALAEIIKAVNKDG